MAKRSTAPHKLPINPIFRIPPGSEDAFAYVDQIDDVELSDSLVLDDGGYSDDTDLLSVDFTNYTDDSALSDTDDNTDEDPSSTDLATPTAFFVYTPMTLRRAPGGQQVVDIVVVTEDIQGATDYEIQVTKL